MKKNRKISASMMCANPFYLRETLNILQRENVEFLHQDIMDGKFVPNLGIGVDALRALRNCTDIPFDFHLMVLEPDNILPLLGLRPGDIVSIHYESTFQVQRTLENAAKYGAKVFLAINPASSLHNLEEVVHCIDGINLLMVNPGFSGQKMVQSSSAKLVKLFTFLQKNDCELLDVEVDGAITIDNSREFAQVGANIFVAGTSSIFHHGRVQVEKLRQLRDSLMSVQ